MTRPTHVFLFSLVNGLFAFTAAAGIFTWSPPIPIITAERALNLPGTIVGAETFGATPRVAMLADNTTIDFKADGSVASVINSTAISGGSGSFLGAFTGATGNREFDTVLDAFSYDGGPKIITIYNLNVGWQYSVQLFAQDERTATDEKSRLASFQDAKDANNVSASFAMGDRVYVLGKFTAPNPGDGSSTVNVSIQENLPMGGKGNLNALVIRALGKTIAPQFTTQPQPATVYAGVSVKFNVVAIGKAPSYQWQVKTNGDGKFANVIEGGKFSGTRTPSLTLSNSMLTDNGEYRAIMSGNGVTVTSGVARLTVLPTPAWPVAESYAGAVLAQRPLAYWRLNEAAGTPLLFDSGGAHHLLNNSVALGVAGFSTNSSAGFFNGQDSAATSDASLMNALTNFTVLGWFNPAGAQNGSRIGLFGQNDAVELGYDDVDGVSLYLKVANTAEWLNLTTGSTGFHADRWYFTAVVADGTNVVIFINGLRRAHQANTGPARVNSTYNFNVGGGGILDVAGNFFYGAIQDVAVFDHALPAEAILNLYGNAAGVVPPSIVTEPESQVQGLGGVARFEVTADGSPPLYYQWQVSAAGTGGFANLTAGGGFFGVTTPHLTITNLTLNQVDSYRVVITNAAGAVASRAATLSAFSTTPLFVWSSPTPVTTADMTLDQPGNIVWARVFGTGERTVVLGSGTSVYFQTNNALASVTNGSFVWGGPGTTSGAFTGSTGNPEFDEVLSQFDYDGGPKLITLHNLGVGRKYSVQLFALDDRIGVAATRRANFQNPKDAYDISTTFNMSDNVYVIGTFTVPEPGDGRTKTDVMIQQNLPTGAKGNLNAMVVREIVSTTAP